MTPDRDVRRTTHVAPVEQHYADLGVAEFVCPVHGTYHVARASLAYGASSDCYWCRADAAAS